STTFNKKKITKQVVGKVVSNNIFNLKNIEVFGYEIHNGISNVNKNAIPFIKLSNGEIAGVINEDESVLGTYLHGIFDEGEFLKVFIKYLVDKNKINFINEEIVSYSEYKLREYDKLSKILEENIDMEKVEKII
ncbi:cobyric acid synthase CobQ, partial [Clostridium perfringens]|nr:cobyric acid synthase CobQ [Clostridium perfringens]